VDAVLAAGQQTISAAFVADSVILRSQNAAFLTDAVVRAAMNGSLSTAAVLRVASTGTLLTDAIVFRSQAAACTADAVILAVVPGALTADAILLRSGSGALGADAIIAMTASPSFGADAVIVYVGRPVWTTPPDLTGIVPSPTLAFTMPSAKAAMHFWIELDTVASFDSGNYISLKSHLDQAGWEYWDGAAWQPIPQAGVPNSAAGNEARHTLQAPLANGAWYRRVRGGTY
jgi:hypothetical protein